MESIQSALSRGISVQVNHDFKLVLSVKFGELPGTNILPLQCEFDAP